MIRDLVIDRPTALPAEAVETLCELINRVYEVGEAGLWHPGASRTDVSSLEELLETQKLLLASIRDKIVGCIQVNLSEHEAEFGMLTVDMSHQKHGIGAALIQAVEHEAIQAGYSLMRLYLLVPITGTHPAKEKLKSWYEAQGYIFSSVLSFEEVASKEASTLLIQSCQFLMYCKNLVQTQEEC